MSGLFSTGMILEQSLVPHDIPVYLEKMKDMYEDLFSGGKGYRGALVFSIAQELGLSDQNSALLSNCIEYIHNSSLLHDDFVDGADLRRGKTTAWKKYGGGYAILGGDYLLAKVIQNLCGLNSIELIDYTSGAILALVEGEWLQDACHGRADVTKEEMNRVHSLKTSALFSWCFKAPAIVALDESNKKCLDELFQIGDLLGSLLQRSDDLLDYNIRNFEEKAFFKDLPSGYFNLFTIHLLEGINVSEKEKAFEFISMSEFLNHYKIDLDEKLKTFDEENQIVLDRVKGLIQNFELFSGEFKQDLISAADQIYWRKKV